MIEKENSKFNQNKTVSYENIENERAKLIVFLIRIYLTP